MSGGVKKHFHILWISMIVILFMPSGRFQMTDTLVYVFSVIYVGFYVSRLYAKSNGGFALWKLLKSAVNAIVIFLILFRQDEAQSMAIILFSATYLIDRWLLNTLLMKWQMVLNLIAILVSVFFIVYAQIQSQMAYQLERELSELKSFQLKNQEQLQMELANTHAAEAEAAYLKTRLEECEGRVN